MREKILLDENWAFHEGDLIIDLPKDKGPIYMQAKVERKTCGPASKYYNGVDDNYATDSEIRTEKWETVNLPHDYIIRQRPNPNENNALGYFKYSNAWYRKKFILSEEDKNKRLTILFEGVATHATVYLNGCLLKHNFCGYNSFEVNITDVANFDEENILAVYVQSDEHEGWWYEGAGIYRHVWLTKTDNVAVDLWGVYVVSEKKDEKLWHTKFETTVINDRYEDVNVEIKSTIYDKENNAIATAYTADEIRLREKKTVKYDTEVINPTLWDLDNPYLYTVKTEIFLNGTVCDLYATRIGFRTVELNPDKGFFLNGKHIKINGVCAHQDLGLTGKAVADNVQRYKIELIKEMGANGYRTSHYPHSEATMDALDELGFIVMDETRWFDSSEEGTEQLEMLIKRDRNRPSVVFWSTGNEEPYHINEKGRRINKNLVTVIKKLDNTRYVTTAVSNSPHIATVYDDLDVIGINYNLDKYDDLHNRYPQKPIFASECCATGTTRGWYFDDCAERGYLDAYDKDTNYWFLGRERTCKFLNEREWVLGSFQWTAFEHRGETMWPRLCSQSGAIDLYLQKKDAFYQNQSHWIKDRPIVHLLPHWNFKGLEGQKIRVSSYTNCEELELFLNDKSLGRKQIENFGHGEWQVEYEPGTLTVVGYQNGKAVAKDAAETTGKPEKLVLKLDNKVENANGTDVAVITCYCIDSQGREVPTATPFVEFNTNTLGKIIATGSDVADHEPVYLPKRKMQAGKITVAVKVGNTSGDLKIYASSENLESDCLTIPLK